MPENNPLTGYPSIDKPWLRYYAKKASSILSPEMSMYYFLDSIPHSGHGKVDYRTLEEMAMEGVHDD